MRDFSLPLAVEIGVVRPLVVVGLVLFFAFVQLASLD
jgi:hypothetical protein